MNQPFIFNLVGTVEKIMGDTFPEIVDKKSHIEKIIKAEETSFNDTLDRGLSHFNKVISNMSGKTIPGSDAFKLYDTFGFPLDLTQLMAREKGLSIDEDGFKKEMDQQKKRAKSAEKFNTNVSEVSWNELKNIEDSKFKGYEAISLSCLLYTSPSPRDS